MSYRDFHRRSRVVYRLTPPAAAGGQWTETIRYAFSGRADGRNPSSVVFANGVLTGTAARGGSGHAGTLFQLTPPAGSGGAWSETVLHEFTIDEGRYPQGLLPSNGVLYGTCLEGGVYRYGFGSVFDYAF